jgi:putative oxidoreductase
MSAVSENRLAGFGVLLLRLTLGGVLLSHGLLKLLGFSLSGTVEFFDSLGVPGYLAYPVVIGEIGGGLLLILGLFSRWISLALLPILFGALWVHSGNGWLFSSTGGGWEFPLVLVLLALIQALLGNGAYALRWPVKWQWRRGGQQPLAV